MTTLPEPEEFPPFAVAVLIGDHVGDHRRLAGRAENVTA